MCVLMEESIVLYPPPAMSHLISMVEFGKLMLKLHPSFSIHLLICTPPHNSAASIARYIASVAATTPSLTFHHLPPISLPPNTSTLDTQDPLLDLPLLNNPNVHKTLQTISLTSNLKALVINLFCGPAFEVASSLNIPVYHLVISGAAGLATLLYLPTFHRNTTKSLKDDLNMPCHIPGLPQIPASDMPQPMLDRNTKMYDTFMNIATQMSKSKGIIVNTFELLETNIVKAISDGLCIPNAPTPPIYCIGPFIDTNKRSDPVEEKHQCLHWLDSQPSRSVVFLCFGSLGSFSAKQMKEIAIGLENSGHRFLWVVCSPPTDDKKHTILAPSEPNLDEILPKGFLERTKDTGFVVKQWAPQVDVLSHESVGGFVTHCGWKSVLEAVCCGVPMVAWPLFAEQRLNGVILVEEMKAALVLRESEDGFVRAVELEKKVRELMELEAGKEVRKRVMAAKDVAITAMKEGGSSVVALAKLAESWKQG